MLELPLERTVVDCVEVLRVVVERTAEDPDEELGAKDRYCDDELPDLPVDLPEELSVDRPVEPLLPELLTVDFEPLLLEDPFDRMTLLPVLLLLVLLVVLVLLPPPPPQPMSCSYPAEHSSV